MLGLGIAEQSNKTGCTSGKYLDSVHYPPIYSDRVCFNKVILYGVDWGARVIVSEPGYVFGKNRVYDCINVIRAAIRANFLGKCVMIACRAVHFNISLNFLHVLSALFGIQFKSSCKTLAFIL